MEKAVSVTYSECGFVGLVFQHAKLVRHIILSPLTCLTVPYFSNYLMNGTDVGEKLLNLKYVSSLQSFSEIFLIQRRIERDIVIDVGRSLCKVPVILVRF